MQLDGIGDSPPSDADRALEKARGLANTPRVDVAAMYAALSTAERLMSVCDVVAHTAELVEQIRDTVASIADQVAPTERTEIAEPAFFADDDNVDRAFRGVVDAINHFLYRSPRDDFAGVLNAVEDARSIIDGSRMIERLPVPVVRQAIQRHALNAFYRDPASDEIGEERVLRIVKDIADRATVDLSRMQGA